MGYAKPSLGTSVNFIHGKDITITRANIERVNRERAKGKYQPLTAEGIVNEFVRCPKGRHFVRANRLMAAMATRSSVHDKEQQEGAALQPQAALAES